MIFEAENAGKNSVPAGDAPKKRAIDLSFAESGGLAPYKDGRITCRKGNEIYYTLATTDGDGDYIGYAKKRLERAAEAGVREIREDVFRNRRDYCACVQYT